MEKLNLSILEVNSIYACIGYASYTLDQAFSHYKQHEKTMKEISYHEFVQELDKVVTLTREMISLGLKHGEREFAIDPEQFGRPLFYWLVCVNYCTENQAQFKRACETMPDTWQGIEAHLFKVWMILNETFKRGMI